MSEIMLLVEGHLHCLVVTPLFRVVRPVGVNGLSDSVRWFVTASLAGLDLGEDSRLLQNPIEVFFVDETLVENVWFASHIHALLPLLWCCAKRDCFVLIPTLQ